MAPTRSAEESGRVCKAGIAYFRRRGLNLHVDVRARLAQFPGASVFVTHESSPLEALSTSRLSVGQPNRRHLQIGAHQQAVSGFSASCQGYRYLRILFVADIVSLVFSTLIKSPRESLMGLVIVALGVPFYLFWSRKSRAKAGN